MITVDELKTLIAAGCLILCGVALLGTGFAWGLLFNLQGLKDWIAAALTGERK